MFLQNDAFLEEFWDNLLSSEPQKILTAFKPLDSENRQVVLDHLNRMLNEVGWHSEQRESAQTALKTLKELFIEEERNKENQS
ncbi:MAG: hypothetical protein K8R77_13655 [Anaerolineaceae bacterium]|nr:hypothetical protein [Anaerolineaceae bacterium]